VEEQIQEYKVLHGMEPEEAQKLLNQWRHDYHLTLHGVNVARGVISMVVERKRK
jgi:hypothetical protein